jgi:hypothetical protein
MDDYSRYLAQFEDRCAHCGNERSRRRGVVIDSKFYCADCYTETQNDTQAALAERCRMTDADVNQFAIMHTLTAPSPVKFVAIPRLGAGHRTPRLPTLRRAEVL